MTKTSKPRLPHYLSPSPLWHKDISQFPDHKDSLLPDWFKFGLYENMIDNTDRSFWALEFAVRGQYESEFQFVQKVHDNVLF